MSYFIQLLTAFTGSLGFALLFNVREKKLIPAAIGGLISWAVYLLAGLLTPTAAIQYFMASIVLTFYAEIFARVKKAPATIFLVSGAIPLFPGGRLYQTMNAAVKGNWKLFGYQGLETIIIALAIAVGMLCTMTIFRIRNHSRKECICQK